MCHAGFRGAGNELNRDKTQKKSVKTHPSLIPGIDLPETTQTSCSYMVPRGWEKHMYCRQFLKEGLLKGDRCIFVSTAISKMQFDALFSNEEDNKRVDLVKFVNPFDKGVSLSHHNNKSISGRRLVTTMLSDVIHSLETTSKNDGKVGISTQSNVEDNTGGKATSWL